MHKEISPTRTRKSGATTSAFAALLIFAMNLPTCFGKDSPLPVTVEGSVSVQGSVEVANDALYQPFFQQISSSGGAESPYVTIDIPDGKRLVIETISFFVARPATKSCYVTFYPWIEGGTRGVFLPVQYEHPEGNLSIMISTIPFRMRVDSIPGNTRELAFGTSAADSELDVSVCGYLVDL